MNFGALTVCRIITAVAETRRPADGAAGILYNIRGSIAWWWCWARILESGSCGMTHMPTCTILLMVRMSMIHFCNWNELVTNGRLQVFPSCSLFKKPKYSISIYIYIFTNPLSRKFSCGQPSKGLQNPM